MSRTLPPTRSNSTFAQRWHFPLPSRGDAGIYNSHPGELLSDVVFRPLSNNVVEVRASRGYAKLFALFSGKLNPEGDRWVFDAEDAKRLLAHMQKYMPVTFVE